MLFRSAFENLIVVCSAIGGSTNAPVHYNAVAAHIGVPLDNDDWERLGHAIPLLVDLQPAGRFLGEDYFRAGGVRAVIAELLRAGKLPHPDALTVNGKTIRENCEGWLSPDREVIREYGTPMLQNAGFLNLKGNLFDSEIGRAHV